MSRKQRRRRDRKVAEATHEKRTRVGPVEFENLFGIEQWSDFRLEDIDAALRRSVWLFASVYRLAAAVSNIGVRVLNRDTKDVARGKKAKAVARVLEDPNPDDTYLDFLEQNIVHLLLGGEATIEKARAGSEVVELWPWNPARVAPVPDESGRRRVAGFRFVGASGRSVFLPPSEVVHVRVYNPNNPLRGMSAAAPIWPDIQGDQHAARHNRSVLENGMRVGGILQPTDGDLGDPEFKRLDAQVRARHRGPDKSGRLLLLPFGMNFTPDGATNRDMEFLGLRKFAREIASGAVGTPPMIIGNFDSATYANAGEQLRGFWDYVGRPLLRRILLALTKHWIRPDVDEGLTLDVDMAAIDALVDSQSTRVTNTNAMLASGAITINEARRELGRPPIPDGDRLLMPLALDPRPVDDVARPEPPEPAAPAPSSDPDDDDSVDPDESDEDRERRAKAAADRNVAREAHERALRRAERKLEAAVASYLEDAADRAIERLRDCAPCVDVDAIVGNAGVEEMEIQRALSPAIVATIRDAGATTLRRLSSRVPEAKADGDDLERLPEIVEFLERFEIDNPRILAYLERHFLVHLSDLTSATLAELRAALVEGLGEGEGVNELVLRVRSLPAFSADRAERISRTETIGAFNLGAHEAFRAQGTPRKSWLSTRDEKVRESHLAVEAKTIESPIPADESFLLEGAKGVAALRFPGDSEGPAWAVVNCRCSMLPVGAARSRWIAHCKAELGAGRRAVTKR